MKDEIIKNREILKQILAKVKKIDKSLENMGLVNNIEGKKVPNNTLENLGHKKNSSFESEIGHLCSEIQIERKDFDKIVEIKDNRFFLKIPIEEKKESVKQVKTTLVLMMLKDVLSGEDFMKSSEITNVLKRLGVKSISNLAGNLSKYKQQLTSKGVKGSKNFGFIITIPGILEGKKILKEFAEDE